MGVAKYRSTHRYPYMGTPKVKNVLDLLESLIHPTFPISLYMIQHRPFQLPAIWYGVVSSPMWCGQYVIVYHILVQYIIV